ncbi:MAG: hypothetical protein V7L05_23110 [Nostoc sp.]|uniref:hypothetical protein n=1 Tax=Nostoc sp. TaxID=1180 RepID=UPI002FFA6E72
MRGIKENNQCPMPNAQCPFFLKTYTRGECATLVLWFRVELAIKLNKTANGV